MLAFYEENMTAYHEPTTDSKHLCAHIGPLGDARAQRVLEPQVTAKAALLHRHGLHGMPYRKESTKNVYPHCGLPSCAERPHPLRRHAAMPKLERSGGTMCRYASRALKCSIAAQLVGVYDGDG